MIGVYAVAARVRRSLRIGRVRRQIELTFKRLKSILHMDDLPAKNERLARTWLHAHLLFALLLDQAHTQMRAFPPEPGVTVQPAPHPSPWRITKSLAAALLHAIWPSRDLLRTALAIATQRRWLDPPRKRRLQMQSYTLCQRTWGQARQ